PDIPQEKRQRENYDWEVTKLGLTMIRIPAGEFWTEDETGSHPVEISRDFWLSDREITVGLFQRFIDDPATAPRDPVWRGVDTERSPSRNHPMQRVSWYDAIEFCNWLSKREGLDICYEKCGTETILEYVADPDRPQSQRAIDREHGAWRLIEDAN